MREKKINSLKIAMTSFYLPSESKIGAGWAAHRLANAFASAGHRVTMWSPSRKPDDAIYHHVHVPISGRNRVLKWSLKIRKFDFHGFEALICHGDDHFRRREQSLLHIRILHGSCFYEAIYIKGFRERIRMIWLGVTELISAIKTPVVVGVSSHSIKIYPWLRKVIPNSVDLEVFYPDHKTKKSIQPSILFVGTCKGRKRGSLLKQIFTSEIKSAYPNAKLWMVCEDCETGDEIHCTGKISTEELVSLYRKAWIFCLPSTYEGFGIPYIEAMSCGTPVVATSNPGSIEVLDNGTFGVITTTVELGNALKRLLSDQATRAEMTKKGIIRSMDFSNESIIKQYEDLIINYLNKL